MTRDPKVMVIAGLTPLQHALVTTKVLNRKKIHASEHAWALVGIEAHCL